MALTATAVLAGACGPGAGTGPAAVADPPGPDDVVVRLVGLEFEPKVVTVKAGSRVVWTWTDEVVHNVVGETYRSPEQAGGSFATAFPKRGMSKYQCTLHVGMVGTVNST